MPKVKPPAECLRCDGTGKICNLCGESQKECRCAANEVEDFMEDLGMEQFDKCEECRGTGK